MDRRSFIKSLALVATSAAIAKAIPAPLRHMPLAEAVDDGPWIPCDGRSLKCTSYPELFRALGDGAIYGPGDGESTFRIPDCTGIVEQFTAAKEDGNPLSPKWDLIYMIAARPDAGMPPGWIHTAFVDHAQSAA
jgi:hypothetical protein